MSNSKVGHPSLKYSSNLLELQVMRVCCGNGIFADWARLLALGIAGFQLLDHVCNLGMPVPQLLALTVVTAFQILDLGGQLHLHTLDDVYLQVPGS